jgi:PIN domain nuclease of toxin-antitoxin system
MRCLLDTHLLLWLLAEPDRVPRRERERLRQGGGQVFYSVASLWEIAIKHSLGRLSFGPDPVFEHAERSGFQRLSIEPAHIAEVARLPWHHRDPFDRLLVAQSIAEPLKFLTFDTQLSAYGPTIELLGS